MGGGMAIADDDSIVVGFPTFSPINTRGNKFIKITGGNILKLEGNGVTTPQSKSFQDIRKQLGRGKGRIPYLGSAVASGAVYLYCHKMIFSFNDRMVQCFMFFFIF